MDKAVNIKDSEEILNHPAAAADPDIEEGSLEEGEIVEEDEERTFKEQDDFILDDCSQHGEDITVNIDNGAAPIAFDRSTITKDGLSTANTDLKTLDLAKVDVYDARRLENELIDQASKAIDSLENNSTKKRTAKIANLIDEADESVKTGDLTPFELMIKTQEELAAKRHSQIITPGKEKKLTKERQLHCVQKLINFPKRRRPNTKSQDQDSETDEDDTATSSARSSIDSNSEEEGAEEEYLDLPTTSKRSAKGHARKTVRMGKDDGDDDHFKERIREYKAKEAIADEDPPDYHELKEDYRISKFIWNKLFKYQKTGVRWLYELHDQFVGGILADEMGLGKTIQICAFFRSLAESQMQSQIFKYKGLGPSLIVCPATVLHQWVRELNIWFPLCKVAVFHSSGAHTGSKNELIKKMSEYRRDGSILVTSYSTYMLEHKKLLRINWHYVILDEGHKIRNPSAKVTLTLKELRTPHRIILSGSPLQNNLKELWSLIDFIYPGRLGSLKEFVEKFSIPITQGGYANATAIQVRTAYKCACLLRDAINPYLLRRMKRDVQMVIQLPEKMEQILFCEITTHQRSLYEEFLESKTCKDAMSSSQMPFAALIQLRKLCNHPDLVTGGPNKYGDLDVANQPELDYGAYHRSGKMIVVRTLLRLWFEQGQKVLLFSQSRQMLTIIEQFIILEGYEYLRMDGTTPIGKRQDLVNSFNNNEKIFIFLLTTRVGGLGINLTGANRVLIYDPDWNPSTDNQARERAWRIGQNRAVTIYRLLTSGTIEEKIYQRQIFKHFLANRVLVNPKQQRFFKTNDLHELFTLGAAKSDKKFGTETAVIFSTNATETTSKTHAKEKTQKKIRNEKKKIQISTMAEKEANLDESLKEVEEIEEKESPETDGCELTDETKERLRRLAKRYAANFSKPSLDTSKSTKKRSKKATLFDDKYEVPMLKKQETIRKRHRDESEEEEESMKSSKEQDDYVLGKLLKRKSGVHSALQHDQIIKTGTTADIQLIEDEAEAVAKRAAEVLKRSRRVHQTFLENASEFSSLAPKVPKTSIFGRKRAVEFASFDEVTVKGKKKLAENAQENKEPEKQFDGSPFMKSKDKATVSGADLLHAIRQRKERQLDITERIDEAEDETNEIQNYPSLSAQVFSSVTSMGDRYEKMAEDIHHFLTVNNGQASTNTILGHFKDKVPPQDAFVFRSTLKRLCRLLPNSQWRLNDQFV